MFKSDKELWYFRDEVIHKRRYNFSKRTIHFLAEFKKKIKNYEAKIKKGAKFVRAQKGHDWIDEQINGEVVVRIETAFPPDRMKPIKDKASEGRMNPKGIPYLYLSNDLDTAISETRPWIGDLISVGVFKIKVNLKLVHFIEKKSKHIVYFHGPPKEKYDEIVWDEINILFSKPISDYHNTAEYIPTQILSEIIRNKGYDGIVYRSNVGNGFNIVLFDLDTAYLTSRVLHKINKMTIKSEQFENPHYINDQEEK